MDSNLSDFRDILEARRQGASAFMWVSRELKNIVPHKQTNKPTPKLHKTEVLQSLKIQELIEKACLEFNVPKGSIVEQIKEILTEIGYNKQLTTIRWLGLALTKICLQVTTGIFVNEVSILKLRSQMGDVPVIYVPSHRSYADFILMSYVLFYYDIEIPAIAAGMDFHGMWGMGSVLRDTGAFFMRRSYNNDPLYWDTFKQYVMQLVMRGENGIEFFIEGTRSRTNKTLPPKFGLLSMILRAYFNGDVSDIIFCPINITYDRILEEKLFAFELLGVPKPKESTSGFFKSLSIIKENFGTYYVNFGDPISVRSFFGKNIDRSVHNMKPKHLQTVTENEKKLTSLLANTIVVKQQKLSLITTFNMVAIVASYHLISKQDLDLSTLINEVCWFKDILKVFGGIVESRYGTEMDILKSLDAHRNLLYLDDQNRVQMLHKEVVLDKKNNTKLKGHELSEETMTLCVPHFLLQLYINPVFFYVIDCTFLALILDSSSTLEVKKDYVVEEFEFLRSVFSKDFVRSEENLSEQLDDTIKLMKKLNLVKDSNDSMILEGNNSKLKELLLFLVRPYIVTYVTVFEALLQIGSEICKEKTIFVKTQAKIEAQLSGSSINVHPYSLSLDTIQNCLLSLCSSKTLIKSTSDNVPSYELDFYKLGMLSMRFNKYLNNLHQRFKNKL